MSTPSPTVPLQNINLNVKLGSLASVSVISKTDRSFSTECINPSADYQSVLCPVPNPGYRNISSVVNVTYPYSNFRLAGTSTTITLDYTGSYSVNRTLLGLSLQTSSAGPSLPTNMSISANDTHTIQSTISEQQALNNQDPTISLDVHSLWLLVQTALSSFYVNSSKIANASNIIFSLDAESCLNLDATDTVYQLALDFNSTTFVTANGVTGNELYSLTQNITSNGTSVFNLNGEVSFQSNVNMIANMILTKINNVVPATCEISTSAPTPAPQLTSGVNRYGVITDPVTGKNSLGVYYGFSNNVVNSVFNYNSIDKYAVLVTSDSCFKVKVWIVIPIFIGFIIFPLWIDTSIVTSILGGFETALSTASGVLTQAISVARDLRSQVSVKNYLAYYQKQLAIAKALTTEDGIMKLANTVKKTAEKQAERLNVIGELAKLLEALKAILQIIEKVQEFMNNLSNLNVISKLSNPSSVADPDILNSLAETIKTISEMISSIAETLIDLVDLLPDMAIKRKIQEIIQDSKEFIELLQTLTTEAARSLVKANESDIVAIVVQMLEVMLNKQVVQKLFKIANDVNFISGGYELLLEEVKNLAARAGQEFENAKNVTMEAINTANELATIGENQDKSALEQAVTQLAEEAAAEIDNMIGTVADVLQVNQLENFANAGLDLAVSGISSAANALGSAAEGIEAAKRNQIRGMISSYLTQNLDIYKVTRLGHFDENNPTEKQILVNDLAGTRIYSSNGSTLLFERKDFCKNPFIALGNSIRLNGFGCQSDVDPCGVGGYNCQELNYWYSAFKYRISFDFYVNHNLALGGVVVFDADGDGVDDIMCHLPGTTRNYDKITKDYAQRTADDKSEIVINNEIIYSPLKSVTSNGRFQSIEQSLLIYNNTGTPQPQKDWCKDGIIRTGDFNGDKKADLLCITLTNNYLLYSNGYTFRPAGNSTMDGAINLPKSTGSLSNLVIVTGDFDGDGYSDILNITKTSTNILYGDPDQIFIQNTTKTNSWLLSNSAQLTSCYNVGVNRIIIEDINNDGRDDISCVTSDNSKVNTIYSTLPKNNNTEQIIDSNNIVKIYINDITLAPYNFDSLQGAQQNVKVNHQTHRNIFGADGQLVFHENMLPEKKSVSDISVSIDCLSLGSLDSEIHISFSEEYLVPAALAWNNEQNTNALLLNLEASAEFLGGNLVKLVSNKIQSFEYKIAAAHGGCYTTETVTQVVTLVVNFNSTAKMIIENQGQLLQGRDLEISANSILVSFDIEEETIVSFPVSGQISINMLGVGYDVVKHCD